MRTVVLALSQATTVSRSPGASVTPPAVSGRLTVNWRPAISAVRSSGVIRRWMTAATNAGVALEPEDGAGTGAGVTNGRTAVRNIGRSCSAARVSRVGRAASGTPGCCARRITAP